MKRKILSILIALVLVFSLLPISALAAYTDVQDHWSEAAIEKWSDLGIIQGSDGKFRPEDPITRGEMAVIIDRIMKFQTAAQNTFTDLDDAFYTDAILKCNAAGIITGDGTSVRPTDNITREEAVVMLGRALGITESALASGFSDSSSISSWAQGFVNAMAAKGFINGSGGAFNPKDSIKRAEIVTILNNAIGGFYNEAKEYTGDVDGIAIINTSGVTLNNMTINGDLIIAEGVGSGEVFLNNVTVTGDTIVRGGGTNSIYIQGNSSISNLIIEKTDDGQIRIVTEDGNIVDAVYVDDGKDDIILTGSFGSVSITAGVTVRAVNAQVELVYIENENARFIIDEDSVIDTVILDAAMTVTNNGTINTAELNVEGAAIEGNEPGETLYGYGVAGAKDTDDGTTGGGGGGNNYTGVNSITLNVDELFLVNGGDAGILTPTIAPSHATNKSITWTSSDETVATVAGGVVTPVGTGTAVITAATTSGKSATATVIVGDAVVSSGESIQAAIDAANVNDVIAVEPGTYAEQLTIDKPLTLLGPNADIPGTGVRKAEAIVTYPAGLTDTYFDLIDVWKDGAYVDNVTIAGFYFNDGGYASDTVYACGIYAHGNNLTIKNNITDGFNYMHIWPSSYREVSGSWDYTYYLNNVTIENNYCINAPGSYMAIYMQGVSGTVSNNTCENAACPIQIQPYGNPNGGSVVNNIFESYNVGVYYNYATCGAGEWVIQNNSIRAVDSSDSSATRWVGIRIQTFGTSGAGSAPSVVFSGNTVDGTGLISNPAYTSVYGIYTHNNIDPAATATFTGNIFTNVEPGAYENSGTIDLDAVLASNTFPTGMAVIGDKIMTPVTGTVYNTTTGSEYGTIQAAIDAATAGDEIFVAPGTYVENVNVNKNSIVVEGAGASSTTIVATSGNSTPLTFSADNATVTGFTLTHNYTETELTDWNFNNNGAMFAQGKSGNTLTQCTVTLSRNGIYLNNCQNNNIVSNVIENNRTGINFCNNVDNTYISGNTISDNWTLGIVYYGTGTNFDTVTVTGNNFNANWYSEILIKDAVSCSGTLNVSSNTFSDVPVTYTESNDASLNEPGFAAQHPVILGGTAEKSAEDLPTLRIYNSDNVTLQYDGKTMFVDASGTNAAAFATINDAIDAVSTGDTIKLSNGEYLLDQTTINTNLTITGESEAGVVLKPTGGTGAYSTTGGDTSGWLFVQSGSLNISNLTMDGTGYAIAQALRAKGNLTVTNVTIKNIEYSQYIGFGIGVYQPGSLIATNVTMSNIARVGIHAKGETSVNGFNYTGKGATDCLDYAMEIGTFSGSMTPFSVNVNNASIADCLGVASVDGSSSAAIYINTYFYQAYGGTASLITANITNSTISNSSVGVHVGYSDKPEYSHTTVSYTSFTGCGTDLIYSGNASTGNSSFTTVGNTYDGGTPTIVEENGNVITQN